MASKVGSRIPKPPQGVFPGSGYGGVGKHYRATGEFRPPKAGEWYLSGAIVQAYQVAQDVTVAFWIAEPVELVPCPHCQGSGKVVKHG